MSAIKVQSELSDTNTRMSAIVKMLPSAGHNQPAMVAVDFGGKSAAATAVLPNNKLIAALAASATFREYQKAFGDTTGLPLSLRPVDGWQLAHQGDRRQNSFCNLMSKSNRSCAGCLQMQQQICEKSAGAPMTLRCSFGINETSMEVKVGHEVIGYLQTGQVFFKAPTQQQTDGALKQLSNWGLEVDAKDAARRYNATPVVPQAKYQAEVQLLQFFASQLGTLANQIVVQSQTSEPEQITRARQFIEANSQEDLSLAAVAKEAGMSTFYFCKMFRKITGMNFTKYVTRIRVEKAKQLLLNLNFRISEIAYEVGFQSLTHFNRVFKSVAGQSPTEYREQLSAR